MNWYIGQKIVAIKSHSQLAFMKGNEFTVNGLCTAMCNCDNVYINIGVVSVVTEHKCIRCGKVYHANGIWWFSEKLFAPIDQDISELTNILNEPIKELVPMRASNGYIGIDKAMALIEAGWIYRQDLAQTEFKVMRCVNSSESFKLNKRSAIEVKEKIKLLKAQTSLWH